MAITLPRMAFEITGYSYDATRKLNKNQKRGVVTTNADTTKLNTQYSPVPYDVSFQLGVLHLIQMTVYRLLNKYFHIFNQITQ